MSIRDVLPRQEAAIWRHPLDKKSHIGYDLMMTPCYSARGRWGSVGVTRGDVVSHVLGERQGLHEL